MSRATQTQTQTRPQPLLPHRFFPPPDRLCLCPPSPEGSYTDDTSQEHHTPHHRSSPSKPGNHNPDPHEFDDEFDDDDPLPVIGHCKALYSFDGERKHKPPRLVIAQRPSCCVRLGCQALKRLWLEIDWR